MLRCPHREISIRSDLQSRGLYYVYKCVAVVNCIKILFDGVLMDVAGCQWINSFAESSVPAASFIDLRRLGISRVRRSALDASSGIISYCTNYLPVFRELIK